MSSSIMESTFTSDDDGKGSNETDREHSGELSAWCCHFMILFDTTGCFITFQQLDLSCFRFVVLTFVDTNIGRLFQITCMVGNIGE